MFLETRQKYFNSQNQSGITTYRVSYISQLILWIKIANGLFVTIISQIIPQTRVNCYNLSFSPVCKYNKWNACRESTLVIRSVTCSRLPRRSKTRRKKDQRNFVSTKSYQQIPSDNVARRRFLADSPVSGAVHPRDFCKRGRGRRRTFISPQIAGG